MCVCEKERGEVGGWRGGGVERCLNVLAFFIQHCKVVVKYGSKKINQMANFSIEGNFLFDCDFFYFFLAAKLNVCNNGSC